MYHYLIIAVGGAFGAMFRALLIKILPDSLGNSIPLQILSVNIMGCMMMGFFHEILPKYLGNCHQINLFIATGFLGGFTTFSSFALEFGKLYEKDLYLASINYILLSVIIGIGAFILGSKIGKMI